MKLTTRDEGTARNSRTVHARRGGRIETARRAAVSQRDAGDRQIDEFERTFTLRYEW